MLVDISISLARHSFLNFRAPPFCGSEFHSTRSSSRSRSAVPGISGRIAAMHHHPPQLTARPPTPTRPRSFVTSAFCGAACPGCGKCVYIYGIFSPPSNNLPEPEFLSLRREKIAVYSALSKRPHPNINIAERFKVFLRNPNFIVSVHSR